MTRQPQLRITLRPLPNPEIAPRAMHPDNLERRVAIERDAVMAYVALGANLGDAVAALQQAVGALTNLPFTRLHQASRLYQTAPLDTDSGRDAPAPGGDYFNAVVALQTHLSAPALLDQLQQLEQQAGRERPYRNAPRTLDLDLLLYGSASRLLDRRRRVLGKRRSLAKGSH